MNAELGRDPSALRGDRRLGDAVGLPPRAFLSLLETNSSAWACDAPLASRSFLDVSLAFSSKRESRPVRCSNKTCCILARSSQGHVSNSIASSGVPSSVKMAAAHPPTASTASLSAW